MGKRKTREERLRDVYEAEDSEPEESKQANQRYDTVDNFQYELPEDFEDEEIDEEAAFTADDAQLAQMFSGGDAGEDGEEAAEEDGAAAGPLTRDDFSEDDSEADEMFGRPGGDQQPRAGLAKGRAKGQPADADMDEIFDGVSDPDSDEEQDGVLDSEDPDAADRAKSAIRAALGAGARKQARKAALLDEAMPESEYNVSQGAGPAGELSLGDLLRGLKPASGKMSAQQKQLARLARSAQAVEPSLPGPIRKRKERQAGYAATREDITKWTPIVRANREAATLVLTGPRNDVPRTSTTAALGAKFQPQAAGMEAEVAALLRAAGVQSEQAVEAAEEALALKAVSSEEVHARRAELARMRSLLFRHEAKAKHLAKIKSKDYHRRLKKAARRKAEAAGEGAGDGEFVRLEAEKAEYERAKERLTLKHKNTSQWARRALRRGLDAQDSGTREAIEEQLQLGQALRRKVDRMGAARDSGSEASTESESESEPEAGSGAEGGPPAGGMGRRAAAKAKAAADAILEGGEAEGVSKGLFSLPFMRRAQEARKRQAEAAARDVLAELEGRPAAGEAGPSQGRRNFGLAGGVQASEAPPDFEAEGDSDASGPDEDAEARRERLQAAATASEPRPDAAPAAAAAPAAQRKGGKRGRRAAAATAAGEAAGWEPGQAPVWEQPEQPEQLRQRQQEAQPDAVEAALGGSVLARVRAQQASLAGRAHLLAGDAPSSGGSARRERAAGSVRIGSAAAAVAREEVSAAQLEPEIAAAAAVKAARAAEQQRGSLLAEGAVVAAPAESDSDGERGPGHDAGGLSQHELIAAAFAGDDVTAEFTREKDAEVEAELPGFEAPSLLPGWGAWAAQQREPQWVAAARARAERQKQGARAGRKDAALEGVVISEKWDKKAAKFSAPQLPYPFTSQQALQAAMRQPLGAQFNTHASFRALTRPAVIKGSGAIIQPLKFSLPVADAARQAHSTSNASRPAVRRVSGGMAQPTKKRRAA